MWLRKASLALSSLAFLITLPALAANADRYPSLVVKFPANISEVSDSMRKDIQNFISRARATGPIHEVYVAAWADHDRVGDKNLPDNQVDLARHRARNVRKFMEDELSVDVDTFNMAKRTDLWSRIFDTEEARVKGQAPAGEDSVAWRIKNQGKPQVAVLVAEVRRENRVAE